MNSSRTIEQTKMAGAEIPGYNYGAPSVARSPITTQEFELLKQTAGFTNEDVHWLRVAGDALLFGA